MAMRILTNGMRALAAALSTIVDRLEKDVDCLRPLLEQCRQQRQEFQESPFQAQTDLVPHN